MANPDSPVEFQSLPCSPQILQEKNDIEPYSLNVGQPCFAPVANGLSKEHLGSIASGLYRKGWSVIEAALPSTFIKNLHADLEQLEENSRLKPAGVGRGDDHVLKRNIRRDEIFWLNVAASQAQRNFLQQMEDLRTELNRRLFLGLFEYEAHYANYVPGAFYAKHYDSFRGRANRIVSTVLYLNENWEQQDGGELVLYDEHDENREIMRILPEAGTLVCFLSEEIPHEVAVTQRQRMSIAGWFRCNPSQDGVLDPFK